MTQPSLTELIQNVTDAVDELEHRLRTDPMEYLGDLRDTSSIEHSISRLRKILDP